MVSVDFYWQAHKMSHLAISSSMVLNHYHKNHKTITIYALDQKSEIRVSYLD